MKTFFACGILFAVLSFCGLLERFSELSRTGLSGSSNATTGRNSGVTNKGDVTTDGDSSVVEKPAPTAAQAAIMQAGKSVTWNEQGITLFLPNGWNKVQQNKTLFSYGGGGAFLTIAVSNLAEDFPTDISLKATYDGSVTRKKNGELEMVRYLEISGIKGVEFIEVMPEDKADQRRHQWIGYRKYAGQTQMITLITNSSGANFEKNRDTHAAVLYSMKVVN